MRIMCVATVYIGYTVRRLGSGGPAMDKQVSFQAVCHLLEHLSRISTKDVKKQKLQIYIDVSNRLHKQI